MTVDDLIDGILLREGGFVSDDVDRGSHTKYGITAATLGQYRRLGRPASRAEVFGLTEDEARQIYRERYVIEPGFHRLPEPILAMVVDDGVNSGTATAVKNLQMALRVPADGVLGPQTLAAIEKADLESLKSDLMRGRARRYCRIVKDDLRKKFGTDAVDKTQARFLEGWIDRCLSFR